MDSKNDNFKSVARMNYRSKIYRLALILVPILCSLASLTYILEKVFGLLDSVSWTPLIIFALTNIIYLAIGIYLAHTGTDANGIIISSRFRLAKVFLVISIVIQYNFIYYMIPSEEFWGFIFLFVLYSAFFLDTVMIISTIGLLTISNIIAWVLKPELLLPVHDANYYVNLINIVLAIVITLVLLVTLVYNIKKYLIIMWAKETTEKESKFNEKLDNEIDARTMAEMANKEKTNFLNQLSHEIKTPINVILGMSEMIGKDLQNNLIDKNTFFEYTNNIAVAGNSILDLINEIVSYARIEEGKEEINKVDYKFETLIKDVYEQISPKVKSKGITFEIKPDSAIPRFLVGDVDKIKTILLNIINNAVTYTKEGTVTVNINTITKSDTNIKLKFSIVDTGIGIKKEDMEKIFSSKNDSSSYKGSGLGLNITQSYLQMMGSKLSVDSTFGLGSEFLFEITQDISQNAQLNTSKSIERINKPYEQRFSTKNATILIVDDVEMNIKVAMGLIRNLNLNIDTALSGAEAIEKCKLNNYDIIFMDHLMPIMDGISATREIRKISAYYEKAPIICLTANTAKGIKEKITSEGLNDYLAKPISTIPMEDCIKRWLPKEKIITLIEDEDDEEDNNEVEINNTALNNLDDEIAIPDIEEIDHDAAISILGSERAFREALMMFNDSLDERLIMMQNAVITLNFEDYIVEAHALKGLARTIGATFIADNCEFLEAKCEELTNYELKMRTGELIDRLMKLRDDIERVLSYSEDISYENDESLGDINSLELKLILIEAEKYVDSYNIESLEETVRNLLRYNLNENEGRARELEACIKQINYAGCKQIITDWLNYINSK